ncbi:PepSY domain-containing protein [Agrobacterium sp. ES01]|uniref:PepSY domain-containing protein n=1 Tax=Agrobacterium sp. ES01 TaxID=3420714 RepID=UPI003D0A8304
MRHARKHPVITFAACSTALMAVLMLVVAHAHAGNAHEEHHEQEHDRVLDDVTSGRIKSLSELRRTVLSRVDGTIVDIEIERCNDKSYYEFRILRSDGRVVEVEVDGESGLILQVEND